MRLSSVDVDLFGEVPVAATNSFCRLNRRPLQFADSMFPKALSSHVPPRRPQKPGFEVIAPFPEFSFAGPASNRRKASIGLRRQPLIVGCRDDSFGAGTGGEDFCRMFASRDIDRRRQPVGDQRTWSGDRYGAHLVG